MKSRSSSQVPIGFPIVLLIVALIAGISGVISYRAGAALVANGEHTTGRVVALVASGRSSSPHPVFEFTAADGHRYRVNSNTYSILAPHYVGEEVPLVYMARAPQEARIEETSSIYGIALNCALFCAFPLYMAIAALRARARVVSTRAPYIERDGRELRIHPLAQRGQWGIPEGRRLRFVLWSLALLSLPVLAAFVSERPVTIIVTCLALVFWVFLLLFSSLPGQPKVEEAMRVTRFYSRGALWAAGTFWALLISFVVFSLWRQFPR